MPLPLRTNLTKSTEWEINKNEPDIKPKYATEN